MDINIKTSVGEVRLTKPSGASNLYHIMQGKLYCGQICKMLPGWIAYPNTAEFNKTDLEFMIKTVEEAEG